MTTKEKFEKIVEGEPAELRLKRIMTADRIAVRLGTWFDSLDSSFRDGWDEEEIESVTDQLMTVVKVFRPDQRTLAWGFADRLNELKPRLLAIGDAKKIEEIEQILDRSTNPEDYPANETELKVCNLIELREAIAANQRELTAWRRKHAAIKA
jgi:hypothetical protein